MVAKLYIQCERNIEANVNFDFNTFLYPGAAGDFLLLFMDL